MFLLFYCFFFVIKECLVVFLVVPCHSLKSYLDLNTSDTIRRISKDIPVKPIYTSIRCIGEARTRPNRFSTPLKRFLRPFNSSLKLEKDRDIPTDDPTNHGNGVWNLRFATNTTHCTTTTKSVIKYLPIVSSPSTSSADTSGRFWKRTADGHHVTPPAGLEVITFGPKHTCAPLIKMGRPWNVNVLESDCNDMIRMAPPNDGRVLGGVIVVAVVILGWAGLVILVFFNSRVTRDTVYVVCYYKCDISVVSRRCHLI